MLGLWFSCFYLAREEFVSRTKKLCKIGRLIYDEGFQFTASFQIIQLCSYILSPYVERIARRFKYFRLCDRNISATVASTLKCLLLRESHSSLNNYGAHFAFLQMKYNLS